MLEDARVPKAWYQGWLSKVTLKLRFEWQEGTIWRDGSALGAPTTLAQDPSSIPSTHAGRFTRV